jgi:hypothetical protein
MYRYVCWYHFVKPKKVKNEINPMKIDPLPLPGEPGPS